MGDLFIALAEAYWLWRLKAFPIEFKVTPAAPVIPTDPVPPLTNKISDPGTKETEEYVGIVKERLLEDVISTSELESVRANL